MNWIRTYKGGHSLNTVEQYPRIVKERSIRLNESSEFLLSCGIKLELPDKPTLYEHLHRELNEFEYRKITLQSGKYLNNKKI